MLNQGAPPTLKKIEDILFFLTLLFLPTQLGKHFWSEFSYIYSLKVDYLSPTIYFWDILVVGLLLVWILGRPRINRLALSLFFVFLLTQTLSLFRAENIGVGLVRLEQYIAAGLFGVFIAAQDFRGLLTKIALPLSLGIIGESVLAVLQVINGSTVGLWILGERAFTVSTPGIAKFDFYGFQLLRPYATFPHPNVLAGFVLIVLSIMYKQSLRSVDLQVSRKRQKITKLAMALGGVTVFLTMSRTAILAGLIPLVLSMKRQRLIFAALILLAISPILFTRFSSLFNYDSLTFLRREELIGDAWQIFLKAPAFGVGLNNFIPTEASNLISGPSRFLQPVHNIVFLTMAETGIVGLVGFVLLVGYPLKKMYNSKCTIYNFLPWAIILFLGMFDHYFLTLPQGYRLFFLVWGLSLSVLK